MNVRNPGGGGIDYMRYGAKNQYGQTLDDVRQNWWSAPVTEEERQTAANWRKVAEHLGIKKIDNEKKIAKMYDYVLHGSHKENNKDKEPENPAPAAQVPPPVFGGPELDAARGEFDRTRPWSSGMEPPKLDTSGDPYEDAINHGNALNSHYKNKFLPSIFNEAMLASREVGEAGRFHLKNFVGKVPELGDPKEIYKYYEDRITKN